MLNLGSAFLRGSIMVFLFESATRLICTFSSIAVNCGFLLSAAFTLSSISFTFCRADSLSSLASLICCLRSAICSCITIFDMSSCSLFFLMWAICSLKASFSVSFSFPSGCCRGVFSSVLSLFLLSSFLLRSPLSDL